MLDSNNDDTRNAKTLREHSVRGPNFHEQDHTRENLALTSARNATCKLCSGKGKKVWWNEKFRFPLSSDECKELAKVTLKIMERDKFSEDSLVGETKVHVGDIISEGIEREFLQMKPAPYNVVLEDGRYKGELKLGLKFLPNVSLESLEQCTVPPRRQTSVPYRPFLNITLPDIPWRRLFFFCTRSNAKGSRKTKNS
ncbi:Os02g0665100 [Oryza sativa Japonica Group]|uniref:Os02g0665100 protein n=1 Tax=Oryza sativa subsp. japonica TaxID=39947 RepID=A0A0P0VMN6_ORYSJ|nr:Os02g0665100 [Oryza sativa Japonica Group]